MLQLLAGTWGLVFLFLHWNLRQGGAGAEWWRACLAAVKPWVWFSEVMKSILEGLESNPSQLQELTGPEDEALMGPVQKRSLKFFCAVEVVLPPFGCKSPGVGIAEEPLHQPEEEGLSSAEGGRQQCVHLSVCCLFFHLFALSAASQALPLPNY